MRWRRRRCATCNGRKVWPATEDTWPSGVQRFTQVDAPSVDVLVCSTCNPDVLAAVLEYVYGIGASKRLGFSRGGVAE